MVTRTWGHGRAGRLALSAGVLGALVVLLLGGPVGAQGRPGVRPHGGTRIVFAQLKHEPPGVPATNYDIMTMNADGSGLVNVTPNTGWWVDLDPAWSPDGQRIVFSSDRVRGSRDLYLMNADGSQLTPLTQANGAADTMPAWSPDGQDIVFTSDRKGGPGLWLVGAGGNNLRPLLTPGATGLQPETPRWSPDSKHIVFASGGDLYIIDRDGAGLLRWLSNGTAQAPDWSADGTMITYTAFGQVWVRTLDGSKNDRLTSYAGYGHPRWAPADTDITFASTPDGVSSHLYRMKADGSQLTQLSFANTDDVSPDW
jgi:TolB protein